VSDAPACGCRREKSFAPPVDVGFAALYLTDQLFNRTVHSMADHLSATFAALADPTRRAILARLALGETTVGDLAEPFAMSLPAVSKHLKVLENAGLITRGREAQWMIGSSAIALSGNSGSTGWKITSRRFRQRRRNVAEKNETDPTLLARSIIVSRMIDAPPALVFDAWTDPKYLAQWWGPTGFTTTTHAFDMRPGGIWRFVMHGPDGRDYQNNVTFDEIVKPERIVFHHDDPQNAGRVHHVTTATFEAAGTGTHLTLNMVFPTAEERERVAREHGAVEGGHQTLGRLADYVAKTAGERGA
jgi:uncharacterized protein YndB with AHSA1/START domain/DNA-binding transcriptional ArsR family regulator